MTYKDKEEMLDALYDHLEIDDDDPDDVNWFEEHVTKFFDFLDEGSSSKPRRRSRSNNNSNNNNSARRKRRQNTGNASNAGSSGYGAKAWFGN